MVERDDGQCYGRTFWCSSVGSHEYHRFVPAGSSGKVVVLDVERSDSPAGVVFYDCRILTMWSDAQNDDDGRTPLKYSLRLGHVDKDDTTVCIASAGPCSITARLVTPPGDAHPSEYRDAIEAAPVWFHAVTTAKSGMTRDQGGQGSPRKDPP